MSLPLICPAIVVFNSFNKTTAREIWIMVEITVKSIRIMPIFFACASFFLTYFIPGISPKGGSKKLIRYKLICLPIEILKDLSFNTLPQLVQKEFIGVLRVLH